MLGQAKVGLGGGGGGGAGVVRLEAQVGRAVNKGAATSPTASEKQGWARRARAVVPSERDQHDPGRGQGTGGVL